MASPRAVAVALLLVPPPPGSSPSPFGFLLTSSRKLREDGTKKWVFPKGGVEQGESSKEAAERESWEEAGLKPGQARHLTHLLTIFDESPHILSPSTSPTSRSFVPSSRYEFELFILPSIPNLLLSTLKDPPPSKSAGLEEEEEEEEELSPIARHWPEDNERTRLVVTGGWDELEKRVCWGRRRGVMRAALEKAKDWLAEHEKDGRISSEDVQDDG